MTEHARDRAVSAEAHAAQIGAAAFTADRNQPRWMLLLGAGALTLAVLWLGTAVWQRSSAVRELGVQKEITADLLAAIASLQAASDEEASAMGGDALKPNPLLASEIERLAKDAGVANATILDSDDQRAGPVGVKRRRYALTNMSPQHIEDLLKWINRVGDELPGVELASLDLLPAAATHDGKPRWSGSVTFSRWERRQ
ncbi:MAG: hypothetical protein ACKVS8_10455 [Phycisphaerales bacterium]